MPILSWIGFSCMQEKRGSDIMFLRSKARLATSTEWRFPVRVRRPAQVQNIHVQSEISTRRRRAAALMLGRVGGEGHRTCMNMTYMREMIANVKFHPAQSGPPSLRRRRTTTSTATKTTTTTKKNNKNKGVTTTYNTLRQWTVIYISSDKLHSDSFTHLSWHGGLLIILIDDVAQLMQVPVQSACRI